MPTEREDPQPRPRDARDWMLAVTLAAVALVLTFFAMDVF